MRDLKKKRTYAFSKIGAIEKTVLSERIEVVLNFVPRINTVGFVAYKFQTTKRFVRAGASAIKLRALLPESASSQSRFKSGAGGTSGAGRWKRARSMAVAPREPSQLRFKLLRELPRLRNSFSFQLLRELPESSRRASPDRRWPRNRRRSFVSTADDAVVDVYNRGWLDAAENDGVIVLKIEGYLDELLGGGVGLSSRRSSGADGHFSGNGIGRPTALVLRNTIHWWDKTKSNVNSLCNAIWRALLKCSSGWAMLWGRFLLIRKVSEIGLC